MVDEQDVELTLDGRPHAGLLGVPERAGGLVIFAHGSGSSRLSGRNRYVAGVLREAGLATLLFDLLTETEDHTYSNRFDIDLLTRRLLQASDWSTGQQALAQMPIGYFGASTGAAAALKAAAERGPSVAAVVSRGGRPDLAGNALPTVPSPTLLIVGGNDPTVLDLNRQALAQLQATARLEIIEGATHLFEEPGTLEEAARLARDWLSRYLSGSA